MQDQPKQFVYTKLSTNENYTLLDSRSIIYALNCDIRGREGNNNDYFVQNVSSNALCAAYPPGYELVGAISLNKFEYAIFLASGSNSQIGLLNTNTCTYTNGVDSTCLAFDVNFPIRGVYKENNKDNDYVMIVEQLNSQN